MIDKKFIMIFSMFILFICIASVNAEDNFTQYNSLNLQEITNDNVISNNISDDNYYSSDVLEQENNTIIQDSELKSEEDVNNHFGYWCLGRDMKNLDLDDLSKKGVTDIFLNYYAYTLYNMAGVEEFIADANEFGIHTHIWTQIFYYGGVWTKPIDNGVINQAYFDEKIKELEFYAKTKGLSGIHFDCLRFSGFQSFPDQMSMTVRLIILEEWRLFLFL